MDFERIEIPFNIDKHRIRMTEWCLVQCYGGKLVNYPDWLLNGSDCLPREDELLLDNWETYTRVKQENVSQRDEDWNDDYGMVLAWIIENLAGEWATFNYGHYVFKDPQDAMAFKLTWG